MPEPRPDLVIFDCDGVLVDSEPITNRLLVANLARHGLTLTEAQVETMFVGGTMAGVGERARAAGAALPDDWLTSMYEEMYAELRKGVPPIAGVVDFLDALDAAGVPYAVGSNGSEEKMRITLGQTGLMERFRGRIYSAHTLRKAKPDPALYLQAARDLGIAAGRCAVIDDSPAGCTAGVRAGMKTLGFAETTDPARLVAVGATPVASMAEAARMLGFAI
ncbi:HAD family hydrolase [Oceaniglobus roseus]|uniref:HAD family hydrolase n=1 Tax=Oceaniglobus roseus TaxID=1737570 RepID=UPI000C7F03BE|nr:HAD-IA family hydrolase [Kandeliimicrobium roseum]